MMKHERTINLSAACLLVLSAAGSAMAAPTVNPERECFFGDTHAHSMLSTDAYGFGNRLGPDNAYRFARGAKALFLMQEAVGSGKLPEGYTFDTFKDVWKQVDCQCREVQRAGQVHDLRRLSSGPRCPWREPAPQRDLPRHRSPGDALTAMDSISPGGSVDLSGRPAREQGNDNLAIPHNGNLSNGRMFQLVDSYGAPITPSTPSGAWRTSRCTRRCSSKAPR